MAYQIANKLKKLLRILHTAVDEHDALLPLKHFRAEVNCSRVRYVL